MKEIYLDANFSHHFADALDSFEQVEGKIKVLSSVRALPGKKDPGDMPDEAIIRHIADRNGFLISIDKDFKRQQVLQAIIRESQIGWFYYKGGNNHHWARVKHIVGVWEKIRQKVLKHRDSSGAFLYNITAQGKFDDTNKLA